MHEIKMRVDPLTEEERRHVVEQTGYGGSLIGPLAIGFTFTIGCVLAFSGIRLEWILLAIFTAILAVGAGVIWLVIATSEQSLKREVGKGEKFVIDGLVAELSEHDLEGAKFYSLGLDTGEGRATCNFTVPLLVYRQLRKNESVQVSCLPISKLVLGVTTPRSRWSIGDITTKPPIDAEVPPRKAF